LTNVSLQDGSTPCAALCRRPENCLKSLTDALPNAQIDEKLGTLFFDSQGDTTPHANRPFFRQSTMFVYSVRAKNCI
jgi:hypothetical protein